MVLHDSLYKHILAKLSIDGIDSADSMVLHDSFYKHILAKLSIDGIDYRQHCVARLYIQTHTGKAEY